MKLSTNIHERHSDLKTTDNEFLTLLTGRTLNSTRPAIFKRFNQCINTEAPETANQQENITQKYGSNTNITKLSHQQPKKSKKDNEKIDSIVAEFIQTYFTDNKPTFSEKNINKRNENEIIVTWSEISELFKTQKTYLYSKKNNKKALIQNKNIESFDVDKEHKAFFKYNVNEKITLLKSINLYEDFLSYDNLKKEEQKNFGIFYCKELRKNNKLKGFEKIYKNILKICYKKTDDYYLQDKTIPKFLYDLISYLEKNGTETEGIFAGTTSTQIFKQMEENYFDEKNRDFKKFSITQNACFLKMFIKRNLNGLFPHSISKAILKICKENEIFDGCNAFIRLFWKIIPFATTMEEKKLLKRIFELWTKIDENSKINHMPIANLGIVFGPSLFASNIPKNKENAKALAKMSLMLYGLDLNLIDADLYDKFKNIK
ncbi:Rho GTPase activating protein [Gurleya vavrai]